MHFHVSFLFFSVESGFEFLYGGNAVQTLCLILSTDGWIAAARFSEGPLRAKASAQGKKLLKVKSCERR
jgi:hypothetical protein